MQDDRLSLPTITSLCSHIRENHCHFLLHLYILHFFNSPFPPAAALQLVQQMMSLKSLVISFPHPYRILFLLSLPRFDSLWAVAPLTLLTFFHSPQYLLVSLSAPSCYWQSSLLQYLLNFFQSPSFPPPPLPVPENSLILFLKMYSLPIAFARSPSPPPRKQKSSFCSSSEDHESRWLMVSPSSLTQSLLL